ncbi:MAG: isopentenyl phosphate kinase family protein [Thermoplasmata archaeon]|nr:isopentenyl phosphate kinase family protein [Thermoplasmata archaeon]
MTSEPAAPSSGVTVVKLGGSILTRKRERESLRPKILTRLAEELATAPGPIVVLHGAGSFGHPDAKRFHLAEPPAEGGVTAERRRGAAIVSREVRRLHAAVLKALVDAGVNPWSVPGSMVGRNRSGVLDDLDSAPFADALAAGVTPVSFGDVVRDDAWGFSILSADTIAVELARELPARRVLFVSDVGGVFEPGASHRRVAVPLVTAELIDRLRPSPGVADVTGGIRGKAEAMLAIADDGADAGLISGLSDGALSRALKGDRVYGSWVSGSHG